MSKAAISLQNKLKNHRNHIAVDWMIIFIIFRRTFSKFFQNFRFKILAQSKKK